MRIGLRSLRNRINYAPDGGSVPAAGNPGGNQQQQQQQDNQGQNNNGDNDAIFASMWDDASPNDGNNGNNNNQQQQQNNNNNNINNGDNAAEMFDNYIKSANLTDGIDMSAIQQEMSEGKLDSLNSAFNKVAANVYKRSMMDAQKLIKDNVERAVTQAVNKSRGVMSADMAIRDMNEKLPYTKDKAIAPVAEEVFKRFLKKGQDQETALANVDKYFQRTASLLGGKQGSNRNQGFGNNPNNGKNFGAGDDDPGEIDFLSILSEDDT